MPFDKETLDVASRSAVFKGVEREDLPQLLDDLMATTKLYLKGELISKVGDEIGYFPMVVHGKVQASMPRSNGAQIIARFEKGSSFAEAVPGGACISPVEIEALEDTLLLRLPAKSLKTCSNPYALTVYSNLMGEMAKKVASLSYKLSLLNEPKLRTRVLMYLEDLPSDAGGFVTLPFSRKDLAEYLGAHDKALLRELRHMQDEGIIEADGRRFKVLRPLDTL